MKEIKELLKLLSEYGLSDFVITCLIIGFLTLAFIAFFWSKGLDKIADWIFMKLFKSMHEKKERQKLIQEKLELFLQQHESGEQFKSIEEKIDKNYNTLNSEIKGVKQTVRGIQKTVDDYALDRDARKRKFSTAALSQAEVIEIENIEKMYDYFLEKFFSYP